MNIKKKLLWFVFLQFVMICGCKEDKNPLPEEQRNEALEILVETTDHSPARLSVSHDKNQLQLTATVYPEGVSQNIKWSIIEGGELASIDQSGLVKAIGSKAGKIVVRVSSTTNSNLYTDFEIICSRYRLRYVAGDKQTFGGGMPDPMEYDIIDEYDGKCVDGKELYLGNDHKLKIIASVPGTPIANTDPFGTHWSKISSRCGLAEYLYVEMQNVDPYPIKIKVDLFQDDVIIDTHYLDANIIDVRVPDIDAINMVTVNYGASCLNGGSVAILQHKNKSGSVIDVTMLIRWIDQNKEMRESKVYRIKPGEGINLGCTIPSSTPQPAMYYIAGANFTDAKPPEKETEEEPEEEPDAEPEKKSDAVDILEMLTIKNGAKCGTIGAVAVLHHTDKNGPTIDVTISITWEYQNQPMHESRVYSISPGQSIDLGCKIPGPTPQRFNYEIAGVHVKGSNPPKNELEAIKVVKVSYGNPCGNMGSFVILNYTGKMGRPIEATVEVRFDYLNERVIETKKYRINVGEKINMGCGIPGPTMQRFEYVLVGAKYL